MNKPYTQGYLEGVTKAEEIIEEALNLHGSQTIRSTINAFNQAREDIAYEKMATKRELELSNVPREVREAQILLQQFFGNKVEVQIMKNGEVL